MTAWQLFDFSLQLVETDSTHVICLELLGMCACKQEQGQVREGRCCKQESVLDESVCAPTRVRMGT